MTDDEIKSIAIDHLYRLNTDLSMYSSDEAALIREEMNNIINDDRCNFLYEERRTEELCS